MSTKHLRQSALLILFILSLILISNYGGAISYTLFFAVAMIPLISVAYLIYAYFIFKIYQKIKTRNMIAGESIPYSFILKNEGRSVLTAISVKVFSDFSYVTNVPDNQTFRLFPGEKMEYNTSLICRYRGEYNVGVCRLVITDFLGLFSFSYQVPAQIEAIVKPRIVELKIQNEIPDLDVFIHSNVKGEINEPDLVVRDYIAGDAPGKIHWKSSAKSQKLKVRNDIGVLKEKILLLADFERTSNDIHQYLALENKVLEQTIGLLYHFVLEQTPMELVYHTDQLKRVMISDIGQFNLIYEELSSTIFHEKNHFLSLFEKTLYHGLINEAKLIIMVIQSMDPELFTTLADLSQTSKTTVVYVVTEADISEYSRQNTERFKIIKVGYKEQDETQ